MFLQSGYNQAHQIDKKTYDIAFYPQKINLCEPVKSISCGDEFTMALTISGKLYGWGDNYWGQLGPRVIPSGNNLGILPSGSPEEGLGNERIGDGPQTPLNLCESIESVHCGDSHVVALTRNKNIYVWGNNKYYQLCLGHTKTLRVPTKLDF